MNLVEYAYYSEDVLPVILGSLQVPPDFSRTDGPNSTSREPTLTRGKHNPVLGKLLALT